MNFFKKNKIESFDKNISLYYSEIGNFVNLLICRSHKNIIISFKSDEVIYALNIKEVDKLEFIKTSKKAYSIDSDNFNLFISEFISTLRVRKKLSLSTQEQIYYRINKELSENVEKKPKLLNNYID